MRRTRRTPASRARTASRASTLRVGRGRGNGTSTGRPPGSTRFASTSSPPTPSARTWCRTSTRAYPPSARPLTRTADHSGAVRGNGSRTTARAVSRSACSSPDDRQATSRTWRPMSNDASSTQTGPPQPKGVRTSRWRSRGTARIRSPSSARARARSRPDPAPSRSTTPSCSGTVPASIARKARSVALARSTDAAVSGREDKVPPTDSRHPHRCKGETGRGEEHDGRRGQAGGRHVRDVGERRQVLQPLGQAEGRAEHRAEQRARRRAGARRVLSPTGAPARLPRPRRCRPPGSPGPGPARHRSGRGPRSSVLPRVSPAARPMLTAKTRTSRTAPTTAFRTWPATQCGRDTPAARTGSAVPPASSTRRRSRTWTT